MAAGERGNARDKRLNGQEAKKNGRHGGSEGKVTTINHVLREEAAIPVASRLFVEYLYIYSRRSCSSELSGPGVSLRVY
jgi:hypothetical protein